jgi:hypothetical protein
LKSENGKKEKEEQREKKGEMENEWKIRMSFIGRSESKSKVARLSVKITYYFV